MNQSVFACENSTDTAENIAVMTQMEYTDFSYFNASIFKIFTNLISGHQRQSDIQRSSFLHELNSAILQKRRFPAI